MEAIRCRCEKIITNKMEVEYSSMLNEFFCSPKCATDRYYDVLHSVNVDFSQSLPEGLIVSGGLLIRPTQRSQKQGGSLDVCQKCGTSLSSGTTIKDGERYCPQCGTRQ